MEPSRMAVVMFATMFLVFAWLFHRSVDGPVDTGERTA